MTVKVQITIPEEIKKDIDRRLKELNMNRSRFFLVAASQYLNELRKKQLRAALRQGYKEMQKESREIAEQVFQAQKDALNNL